MKLTSHRASQLDMQMTSMIDVVFLLLIFFMVTSSFQKTERELEPEGVSNISSFGLDSQGELYVVSLSDRVYKLVPDA